MAEEVTSTPWPGELNILDYLYPELLVEIFEYLTLTELKQVTLVCKRFNECAYSPKLWTEVVFCWPEACIKKAVVTSVVERGIRKLSVVAKSEDQLCKALLALPGLRYLRLDLDNFNGKQDPLKVLKSCNFSALKTLVLVWFLEKQDLYNRSRLGEFFELFPKVNSFHWHSSKYCRHYRDKAFQTTTNQELQAVFDKFTTLKTLELSFKDIDALTVLHLQLDTLTTLILGIKFVDEKMLRAIGPMFPRLSSLEFYDCQFFEMDLEHECREHLSQLQTLTFDRCSIWIWTCSGIYQSTTSVNFDFKIRVSEFDQIDSLIYGPNCPWVNFIESEKVLKLNSRPTL